jgi:type IV secretion system protein VirB10
MADEKEDKPSSGPLENPTTHGKKAQFVAIALIVVVILGLLAQGFVQMSNVNKRKARQEAEDEKAEIARQGERPEGRLNDFVAKQKEAAQELDNEKKREQDHARRDKVVKEVLGGDDAAAIKAAPKTAQEEFLQDEEKRVLKASTGKMGRFSVAGQSSGAAQQAGVKSEIARVDAQIAEMDSRSAKIEATRNALLERARNAGFDGIATGGAGAGPAAYAQQPGTQAGGNSFRAQSGGRRSIEQDIFGELASNRAVRDPSSAGPQPGEKILPTGTIVSALTDMDMMSDYAGNWIAVVQRPVYDTALEYILLPQGTKIVGKSYRATSVNEAIQARMGSTPLWAIRPDGKRIDFKKTGAMDASGIGALRDLVDRHFLAQFFGVGAYALIGLGPSMSNYGAEPNSSRDAFVREATGKSRDIGRSFAEKYLNIVPTIRIRAGTPMKIFIEDDIYIKPWEEIGAAHYR